MVKVRLEWDFVFKGMLSLRHELIQCCKIFFLLVGKRKFWIIFTAKGNYRCEDLLCTCEDDLIKQYLHAKDCAKSLLCQLGLLWNSEFWLFIDLIKFCNKRKWLCSWGFCSDFPMEIEYSSECDEDWWVGIMVLAL